MSYFSRDFNPDTDLCQCESCRKNRGDDLEYHSWKLFYNGRTYMVYEKNLPEAKSYAVNAGIYNPEDYPYINGMLYGPVQEESAENEEENIQHIDLGDDVTITKIEDDRPGIAIDKNPPSIIDDKTEELAVNGVAPAKEESTPN